MPTQVVVPAGQVFGFPATVQVDDWARLAQAQGALGGQDGVVSGGVVASASGTRAVTVAPGRFLLPGLLVEPTATVTLNTDPNGAASNSRYDWLVLEANWNTSVVQFRILTGPTRGDPPNVVTGASPSLQQDPGDVYRMPLARLRTRAGAVNVNNAGDILPMAPQARRAQRFRATPSPIDVGPGSDPVTLAVVSTGDPGFPYFVHVDAAVRVAGAQSASGYADLLVDMGYEGAKGSNVLRAESVPLKDASAAVPVQVSGTSSARQGSTSVELRCGPLSMDTGTGDRLVVQDAAMNDLTVLLIPA